MDKETISHYGWIITVLIAAMAFMLMGTPLSVFVQNNMQQMSLKHVLESHMVEKKMEPDLVLTDTITITYQLDNDESYWNEFQSNVIGEDLHYDKTKKLVVNTVNSLPTNLVKEGYELQGWSQTGSAPALTQWKAEAGKDITLKPVWIETKYPVYLNTNGGYFVDTKENIICAVSSSSRTITVQIPVRDGYEFQGWYYDKACSEEQDASNSTPDEPSSTPCAPKQTFTISQTNITSEIILYAKWKQKT